MFEQQDKNLFFTVATDPPMILVVGLTPHLQVSLVVGGSVGLGVLVLV